MGSIKIGTKTWTQSGRSGTKTQTVEIKGGGGVGSNAARIQLRNRGEQVVEMEDHTDGDWADIIISASAGRFYNL